MRLYPFLTAELFLPAPRWPGWELDLHAPVKICSVAHWGQENPCLAVRGQACFANTQNEASSPGSGRGGENEALILGCQGHSVPEGKLCPTESTPSETRAVNALCLRAESWSCFVLDR